MQLAIVGGNGFVGAHLLRRLAQAGIAHKALSRADLQQDRIDQALFGFDVLVNCAGKKSGLGEEAHAANVALPLRLYRAALRANLGHFVHVGSVAAVASTSPAGVMLGDDVPPNPTSAYGASKLAGDEALLRNLAEALPLTILRPPILIGPDAEGVFGLLRRAAAAGVPLPLASLTNRRSFMHVDNFAEAILATIRSRCYGVFITTDSKPTTPEELYRQMVQCAGHSPRLFTATHVGRLILRRLLGKRGGSLFESAAFDGGRFAATTGVRWAIEEEQIVADTMRTRSL